MSKRRVFILHELFPVLFDVGKLHASVVNHLGVLVSNRAQKSSMGWQ